MTACSDGGTRSTAGAPRATAPSSFAAQLFLTSSWGAPVVKEEHLIASFGWVPGTQNRGVLSGKEFRRLVEMVGISDYPDRHHRPAPR